MTNATLDSVIWVLIYGGLLVVVGLAAVAAGVVLIFVRSRRADDGTTEGP